MNTDLSLLDPDRLKRAADGMISNHGMDALEKANRRVQNLRSTGCDAAAEVWERICQLIQVRSGGQGMRVAIQARCRLCGSSNLGITQKPRPDSIVVCLNCGAGEKYRDFERRVQSGRATRLSSGGNLRRSEDGRI